MKCPECQGSGEYEPGQDCERCHGSGRCFEQHEEFGEFSPEEEAALDRAWELRRLESEAAASAASAAKAKPKAKREPRARKPRKPR